MIDIVSLYWDRVVVFSRTTGLAKLDQNVRCVKLSMSRSFTQFLIFFFYSRVILKKEKKKKRKKEKEEEEEKKRKKTTTTTTKN